MKTYISPFVPSHVYCFVPSLYIVTKRSCSYRRISDLPPHCSSTIRSCRHYLVYWQCTITPARIIQCPRPHTLKARPSVPPHTLTTLPPWEPSTMFFQTIFANCALLSLALANTNIQTVTVTEVTTVTLMNLGPRQNSGEWVPDATFVSPGPLEPSSWMGPSYRVPADTPWAAPTETPWVAPTETPWAAPTPTFISKTPGATKPDDGHYARDLIIILSSIFGGLPLLGIVIFAVVKCRRRHNGKDDPVMVV